MVQGKEETEGRHGGLGLLGALHEHEHDHEQVAGHEHKHEHGHEHEHEHVTDHVELDHDGYVEVAHLGAGGL